MALGCPQGLKEERLWTAELKTWGRLGWRKVGSDLDRRLPLVCCRCVPHLVAVMAVRGSASVDTGQWKNKQKKLVKKISFSPIFDEKVDTSKIVWDPLEEWVNAEIHKILGFEDDIVSQLVLNTLRNKTTKFPDPRDLTVSLMGFLEKDAYVSTL